MSRTPVDFGVTSIMDEEVRPQELPNGLESSNVDLMCPAAALWPKFTLPERFDSDGDNPCRNRRFGIFSVGLPPPCSTIYRNHPYFNTPCTPSTQSKHTSTNSHKSHQAQTSTIKHCCTRGRGSVRQSESMRSLPLWKGRAAARVRAIGGRVGMGVLLKGATGLV